MTLNFGPMDSFAVHLHTGARHVGPDGGDGNWPRFLCTDAGEAIKPLSLNTWTHEAAKVTCAECLEWMHA